MNLGVDGFKADHGDDVDLEQLQLAADPATSFTTPTPFFCPVGQAASVDALGKAVPTIFRGGFTGSQHLVTGAWGGT